MKSTEIKRYVRLVSLKFENLEKYQTPFSYIGAPSPGLICTVHNLWKDKRHKNHINITYLKWSFWRGGMTSLLLQFVVYKSFKRKLMNELECGTLQDLTIRKKNNESIWNKINATACQMVPNMPFSIKHEHKNLIWTPHFSWTPSRLASVKIHAVWLGWSSYSVKGLLLNQQHSLPKNFAH